MKKVVFSEKAPAAIGPYSQAIKADKFIYVSGQLPIDASTGEFAGSDITSQTRQSLQNVKYILESEGYTMDDVIKTTVLMKNITEFVDMNTVYAEFFNADCPARAAYEVANLPKAALVEIEAIAFKD